MPIRTFDFCALQFLNQWLEKEANYCESPASSDASLQRESLVAAGGYFRVARNLPKKYDTDRGLQRYEPVLEILNDLAPVTFDNVIDVVNYTRQRISSKYGQRSVLSLTTKFLWLKVKSPVRIYDRQARIALGTSEGDYLAFNTAFTTRYSECQEEIEKACRNLINVISYTVRPNLQQESLVNLVSSTWFRERVLDIYLWNEGSA
ncbi:MULTISPECIES: hypothetical protein [Oligella]|uniref:Uncharacterized protein n=1 Tax=Oligella urethralis DNF00040 TaxID=1401065 RepID=A0A096B542_9BURK|nr:MULTISPECIES: hypothetical protein [Oligella]KGF28369.1 hypothetical protein HMPREF2130_09405 [Oligella urethralis DNF00040]OFV48149.1 hypothetical protein HMPREF3179_06710 [Oligella sp. HMSC09E12]PMC18745.1 hypothetical protein CJ230_02540 [Oligella urethralis]